MTGQNGCNISKDQLQAWIPVLDLATREVFQLMLSGELAGFAAFPPNDPSTVTSMVGLAGKLSGVMIIRCQEKAAALIASRMLGVRSEEVGDEVYDAMGEICNMVAGNFKNKIPGLNDGCELSPPTVIIGNDYALHSQPHSLAIESWFSFESMPLAVTLHIHN